MERPRRLTATFVKRVAIPGRYGDGRGGFGLSILVKERTGAEGVRKSWCQRLRVDGRVTSVGLGPYPLVTLAEARAAALANARAARKGRDPRADERVPTFREAAQEVIRMNAPTWRGNSAQEWERSLERYACPVIGDRSVADVTSADVLRILKPTVTTQPETARRVRGRISAVMKWAIAQRYRDDDPARDVAAVLPRNVNRGKQHHRALPHAEVSAALQTIRQSDFGFPAARLCLEYVALTACRSGEARVARWAEIDTDASTWTIPAAHTKRHREHRVPLSDRALQILERARDLSDGSGLIFPHPRREGQPFAIGKMPEILRSLGLGFNVHGLRTSFRTWAAEHDYPRELAEIALAHANPDKVEAAYQRSDLLDRRRAMMQGWAEYVGLIT